MKFAAFLLACFAVPVHAADIAIQLSPPDDTGTAVVQWGQCQDDLLSGEAVGIREVWGTREYPATTVVAVIEGVEPVRTCITVRWIFANGEASLPELAVVAP